MPNGDSAFSEESFARGYVFTETERPVAPEHWLRGEFQGFQFAHDPRLKIHHGRAGATELLALGILFDVRNPTERASAYMARLAATLAGSKNALFEELSYSSGRYVVFGKEVAGSSFLVGDATCMKSAFYFSGGSKIIASHANLIVANAKGIRQRPALKCAYGYPGRSCPVEGVCLLTPNTELCLRSFIPERFWPTAPLRRQSLSDAVEQVHSYMGGVVEYCTLNFEPVVSVTAGLDSRATFSFLREHQSTRYFSYYRPSRGQLDAEDRAFAQKFGKDQQRNVEILKIGRAQDCPSGFRARHKVNTYYSHVTAAAWAYYERWASDDRAIHIRSNVAEIGREFWRGTLFPVKSSKDLAHIYLGKKPHGVAHARRVVDFFEDFASATDFFACAAYVDIKSLFYWEFRMGAWHSQVVIGTDPAFDTLSIYNCRQTLEAMLSVSVQERADGLILRKIIERNWPELVTYPINGKAFWSVSQSRGGSLRRVLRYAYQTLDNALWPKVQLNRVLGHRR